MKFHKAFLPCHHIFVKKFHYNSVVYHSLVQILYNANAH